MSQQTTVAPIHFKFEFLRKITDEFSPSNNIGSGGYGDVYKGDHEGTMIAVKKLKTFAGFGDQEFQECVNHMNVQHQNIVQLIGFCYKIDIDVAKDRGNFVLAGGQERLLCLEYMHGKNLREHLYDKPCELEWGVCYGIINGICEGLKYLHEDRKIFHLDLKPQNILLDINKIPKIGDFGLSKALASIDATLKTKKMAGTLGYMPPEYIDSNEISKKSDVFSLGVIIIEIMVGLNKRSMFEDMTSQEIIDHVYKLWENRLQARTSSNESLQVKTCMKLALQCVEKDKNKRPTINKIVEDLNNIDSIRTVRLSINPVTDYCRLRDANEQYISNSGLGHGQDQPASAMHRTRSPFRFLTRISILDTLFVILCLATTCVGFIFFFCLIYHPSITVDIEDARLNSFALSTRGAASFLVYNISVAVSVGNPNEGMSITYTKPFVAAISFQDQRLYHNSTVLYEGHKQPSGRIREVHILRAGGELLSDVLGASAVEEFKKQNATGTFILDVRLSGEFMAGISSSYKLDLICPLRLRFTLPPPVMVVFHKVKCVPADLGDKYF